MAYFKKYKTKNKGELWLFKIDVGVDPETGARKTTTRRGFSTKKEAQDAARVMETQREDGTLAIERQGVTIREFLLEWLEVYKRGKVRENTYKIHVYAVNNHLLPLLGYFKVKDLSAGFYQKTINELAKGGLSKRTVEIVHTTMSHAMNKAVELEIIRKNPCSKAKVPDVKKTVRTSRKVIGNYLSRDEVNRFLEEAKVDNQAYYLGFKTMIFLGLRKGEAFALWPEDLDVEASTVRIERTLHYNKTELEEMFGPPKTESSYRFILADPEFMKELKEQARLRKKKAFALQSEYRSETNLLIDRGDGNPLAKSTIQRAFKRILKKAGIDRDVTVHGLRHTHAVMMLESGATLKEVQERLGHKSIEITADVYSHITEKIEKRSVSNFVMYMAGD